MPGFEFFGEEERKEVNDVLSTGILMRYGFDAARKDIWKSRELEKALCDRFHCGFAQLTSSGTSALTTALAALGIGAGDEVIMPCFTFVASFEAVLSVGAVPVLVDINDSLTIDPVAIRKALTPATRCIMPVHMCGSMADMDAIQEICRDHKLLLLEDACQSIGASYKGKFLGTMGDAGTLSFDFVKTITCAEGGAVLTNNKKTYINCDGYSDHGHDHAGNDRGAELHPFLGYNFRISELHAAVGLAQFRKLDTFLAIQKKNHLYLHAELAKIPGIQFRAIPDPAGDSHTFLSWFMPNRELTEAVVAELKAQQLFAGNFYWFDHNWHYIRNWDHLKSGKSLNRLSPEQAAAVTKLNTQDFSKSDTVISCCISTAIGLSWTEDQLHEKASRLAACIKKVMTNASPPAYYSQQASLA
ncbi:MAG TPA: DegT/DnrJ/EryC1/StrS family aminotransferase [Puia sp.]|jgi:8-amino-3,8-dideoxy-alpha-D-manno-octulosonate transaminase